MTPTPTKAGTLTVEIPKPTMRISSMKRLRLRRIAANNTDTDTGMLRDGPWRDSESDEESSDEIVFAITSLREKKPTPQQPSYTDPTRSFPTSFERRQVRRWLAEEVDDTFYHQTLVDRLLQEKFEREEEEGKEEGKDKS